jgi:hypothetical protein
MEKQNRGFEIVPRPAALGGGWKLTLLHDDEEVGGGVFPIPEESPEPGIAWWNSMTHENRSYWQMMAASAIPADARRAYLLAEAYADARQEGKSWVRGT